MPVPERGDCATALPDLDTDLQKATPSATEWAGVNVQTHWADCYTPREVIRRAAGQEPFRKARCWHISQRNSAEFTVL